MRNKLGFEGWGKRTGWVVLSLIAFGFSSGALLIYVR